MIKDIIKTGAGIMVGSSLIGSIGKFQFSDTTKSMMGLGLLTHTFNLFKK